MNEGDERTEMARTPKRRAIVPGWIVSLARTVRDLALLEPDDKAENDTREDEHQQQFLHGQASRKG